MRVLDVLRPPLVAIDVGTATTRLTFGGGDVLEQPSVVREDLQGATIVRPAMRAGVVTDVAGVAGVVQMLLTTRRRRPWQQRPAAVVCAPTDVSSAEREALIEAVAEGGASVVTVVPEPLAAAVGAHVDIASEYASAVLDIGDGVTDFAVFRSGTIVRSRAKRIGCSTFRSAIHEWIELRHADGRLSDAAVEAIVRAYCRPDGVAGAVIPLPSGSRLALDREDLEMLIDPVIDSIAAFVGAAIRDLPDTMAAEVIESGIHVTGGGAHLDRLVRRLEECAGIALTRSPEPENAVIRGAGEMLKNRRLLKEVT